MNFINSLKFKIFLLPFVVVAFFTFLSHDVIKTYHTKSYKELYRLKNEAIGRSIRTKLRDGLQSFHLKDMSGVNPFISRVGREEIEVDYIYLSDTSYNVLFKYDPRKVIDFKVIAHTDKINRDLRFEVDYDLMESEKYLESIIPLFKKNKLVGRIHIASKQALIAKNIDLTMKAITKILLMSSLVIFFLSYLVIKRIFLRPLNDLKQQVRETARSKNFSKNINLNASREFVELGKDFNFMNLSLKNVYSDIQSLNKNLEKIVFERTNELELKSKDLHDKNSTLEDTLEANQNMQKILIQQEKLASLGEVVAGIAHEINNPLNFVINGAALSKMHLDKMRSKLDLDDELIKKNVDGLDKVIDMIAKNGNRATSIVKNMLGHARGNTGEKETVNLKSVVEEFLKLVTYSYKGELVITNISVEKVFDQNVPLINTVKQDIERVVMNLINNAIYALDKRYGKECEKGEPKLVIKLQKLEDEISLRVRDNGTGISKEAKDRIFDPFFTTKPTGEGTGLGMSICHDIITNNHHGQIKVDSVLGEYTEFEVRLPIT